MNPREERKKGRESVRTILRLQKRLSLEGISVEEPINAGRNA